MRLFLAINIPESLRKDLFELGQGLRKFGQVKTVEEENIHLTLKFLGDAEPDKVIKALDGIRFDGYEVSLKGVGAFPSPGSARVVWAGCDKGFKETVTLHDLIDERLKDFEADKRFHPHATLARVREAKDKQGLRRFIEDHAKDEFGGYKVKSFELMSSKLSRKGPEYEIVKSFPL